jgi:hypothetical protein
MFKKNHKPFRPTLQNYVEQSAPVIAEKIAAEVPKLNRAFHLYDEVGDQPASRFMGRQKVRRTAAAFFVAPTRFRVEEHGRGLLLVTHLGKTAMSVHVPKTQFDHEIRNRRHD